MAKLIVHDGVGSDEYVGNDAAFEVNKDEHLVITVDDIVKAVYKSWSHVHVEDNP